MSLQTRYYWVTGFWCDKFDYGHQDDDPPPVAIYFSADSTTEAIEKTYDIATGRFKFRDESKRAEMEQCKMWQLTHDANDMVVAILVKFWRTSTTASIKPNKKPNVYFIKTEYLLNGITNYKSFEGPINVIEEHANFKGGALC